MPLSGCRRPQIDKNSQYFEPSRSLLQHNFARDNRRALLVCADPALDRPRVVQDNLDIKSLIGDASLEIGRRNLDGQSFRIPSGDVCTFALLIQILL